MTSETGTRQTVVIRGVSKNEEGRKTVDKVEVESHNPKTLRYVEKKMRDKGVYRMERHPVDGIGIRQNPPKSGRGGKYTWEGPVNLIEAELDPVPAAVDDRDPNYVDEEEVEESGGGGGVVVGAVEVAKVAEERTGVSRIDVQQPL